MSEIPPDDSQLHPQDWGDVRWDDSNENPTPSILEEESDGLELPASLPGSIQPGADVVVWRGPGRELGDLDSGWKVATQGVNTIGIRKPDPDKPGSFIFRQIPVTPGGPKTSKTDSPAERGETPFEAPEEDLAAVEHAEMPAGVEHFDDTLEAEAQMTRPEAEAVRDAVLEAYAKAVPTGKSTELPNAVKASLTEALGLPSEELQEELGHEAMEGSDVEEPELLEPTIGEEVMLDRYTTWRYEGRSTVQGDRGNNVFYKEPTEVVRLTMPNNSGSSMRWTREMPVAEFEDLLRAGRITPKSSRAAAAGGDAEAPPAGESPEDPTDPGAGANADPAPAAKPQESALFEKWKDGKVDPRTIIKLKAQMAEMSKDWGELGAAERASLANKIIAQRLNAEGVAMDENGDFITAGMERMHTMAEMMKLPDSVLAELVSAHTGNADTDPDTSAKDEDLKNFLKATNEANLAQLEKDNKLLIPENMKQQMKRLKEMVGDKQYRQIAKKAVVYGARGTKFAINWGLDGIADVLSYSFDGRLATRRNATLKWAAGSLSVYGAARSGVRLEKKDGQIVYNGPEWPAASLEPKTEEPGQPKRRLEVVPDDVVQESAPQESAWKIRLPFGPRRARERTAGMVASYYNRMTGRSDSSTRIYNRSNGNIQYYNTRRHPGEVAADTARVAQEAAARRFRSLRHLLGASAAAAYLYRNRALLGEDQPDDDDSEN